MPEAKQLIQSKKDLEYAQQVMNAYINMKMDNLNILIESAAEILDKQEFMDYARQYPNYTHLLAAVWEGNSPYPLIFEEMKEKKVAGYDFRI